MSLYKSGNLSIYFGNASDKLFPADYLNFPANKSIFSLPVCDRLRVEMNLKNLIFPLQVHGVDGVMISSQEQAQNCRPWSAKADYSITNQQGVGLGVVTADCLPVVIYDPVYNAIAVIHAGWQGSVKGIVTQVLDAMRQNYGTCAQDVEVFFGPSARVCCYEVQEDFLVLLQNFPWINQVVQRREHKLFFDVPLFNQRMLEAAGVRQDAISRTYNLCTLCNHSFCSHRRGKELAGRNMTVAALL